MRDLDIDIFTKNIIRRQFGIISAFSEFNDNNIEEAVAIITALENRFDYIIHRGKSDDPSITPLCFTVFNNTLDRISNRHWQKTLTNFASKSGCNSFIIGYDDIVLTDPICVSNEKPLLVGTIKILKLTKESSRSNKKRLAFIHQTEYITATYAGLLSCYGTMLSTKFKISFSTDYPIVKRECVHKLQPTLTSKNSTSYYEKHKYFDSFYTSGYYNFACSAEAMSRARDILKQIINS